MQTVSRLVDDAHFADALAACCYFVHAYRDGTIALLEARNHKRLLVEVLALKCDELQRGDEATMRGWFEKALKLAVAEFGTRHRQTARVHQLYSEALWNRAIYFQAKDTDERLEECLRHQEAELRINEALFGATHANTLRSALRCVLSLRHLGRKEDADALEHKYAGCAAFE